MKIITLNTWGGRAGKEGLLSFFDKNKNDTDIFCLQEIWSAPYEHIQGQKVGGTELRNSEVMTDGYQAICNTLNNFTPYFKPHHGDHYGLLILVKNNIEVKVEGEVFVHKHKGYVPEGDIGNHARNIQFVTFEFQGSPLTVINFHGLWNGKGKTDTEDRVQQSNNIKEFIKGIQGNVLLCGDFNLLPDTESISIIEKIGLRNLIKEKGITSTRTSHYTKPDKFADYIFISSNLNVVDFKVLPDEVSDHSALEITF